jgi:protein-tyrosine phosphatase
MRSCCVCFDYLVFGGVKQANDAKWIAQHKISAIVNLIPVEDDSLDDSLDDKTLYPFGLPFLRCGIKDRPLTGISWVSGPAHFIDQINRDVNRDAKKNEKKKRILIHCQQGISRSPTLVLYYLMTRHDLSLWDAFRLVREQQPYACPSIGFIRELSELENPPTLSPATFSLMMLQEKFPTCDFKTIEETYKQSRQECSADEAAFQDRIVKLAGTDNLDAVGYDCVEKLQELGFVLQTSKSYSDHHPFD